MLGIGLQGSYNGAELMVKLPIARPDCPSAFAVKWSLNHLLKSRQQCSTELSPTKGHINGVKEDEGVAYGPGGLVSCLLIHCVFGA